MRSTVATKDKAPARAIKEKKALEEELQVAKDKLQHEVLPATTQAKIWAMKSAIQARIKMAKEAVNAGFEKAEWNVAKWERTLTNLREDDQEPVATKVGEEGTSKDHQEREV